MINGDHNNFAPRLGFAYDLKGDGKTVVRGGASIYYSQANLDKFMAVNNLYGLRTIPTGVNLYANGNPTPFAAGGTVSVAAATHVFGQFSPARPTTPGSRQLYAWAHNELLACPAVQFHSGMRRRIRYACRAGFTPYALLHHGRR